MTFAGTLELEDTVNLAGNVIDISKGLEEKPAEYSIPEEIYIPEDALEVITQAFEGPLDLLLYLIRKNKFDVLDIPVAEVAEQYAEYIDLMQKIHLELAGEYLAMAATLAHIKSRLLLPPQPGDADEEEEEDPRLELAKRLEVYGQIRQVARLLEIRPRVGREIFVAHALGPPIPEKRAFEPVELSVLIEAFKAVLRIAELSAPIQLKREPIFVKDRVKEITEKLKEIGPLRFDQLFDKSEGRTGLVVTFLALLELISSNKIYASQAASSSPIHIHLQN